MGAVLAAAAPALIKGVASLLGGGPHALDPARKAILDGYASRGDIPDLVAWINDQPPHPISSVNYAKALLQRLTGMQYGGRLATQAPPQQSSSGYLPYRLADGQVVGIPYVTG